MNNGTVTAHRLCLLTLALKISAEKNGNFQRTNNCCIQDFHKVGQTTEQ